MENQKEELKNMIDRLKKEQLSDRKKLLISKQNSVESDYLNN